MLLKQSAKQIIIFSLTIFVFSCSPKHSSKIEGIWYISKVQYLSNMQEIRGGIMNCPFFEFDTNHIFISKNGIIDNSTNHWLRIGDTIKIYGVKQPTMEFRIEQLDSTNLCLYTKMGQGLKFYLNRKCGDTTDIFNEVRKN